MTGPMNRRSVQHAGLLALLLVLGTGCDDSFDPFVEGNLHFALYGVLDVRQDTQIVRVEPVERPGASVPEAITFSSTDLQAGETVAWADTLLPLTDGTTALGFYASLPVRPGRTYRLTAARADDPATATTAEVTVPSAVPVATLPPVTIADNITQRVILVGLEQPPRDLAVLYHVQRLGGGEPTTIALTYSSVQIEEGQRVVVDLRRDAPLVRLRLGLPVGDSSAVALRGLGLRYALANEVPVVIEHGVGEVQAVGAYEAAWTLPPETVEALGFIDAQGQ